MPSIGTEAFWGAPQCYTLFELNYYISNSRSSFNLKQVWNGFGSNKRNWMFFLEVASFQTPLLVFVEIFVVELLTIFSLFRSKMNLNRFNELLCLFLFHCGKFWRSFQTQTKLLRLWNWQLFFRNQRETHEIASETKRSYNVLRVVYGLRHWVCVLHFAWHVAFTRQWTTLQVTVEVDAVKFNNMKKIS